MFLPAFYSTLYFGEGEVPAISLPDWSNGIIHAQHIGSSGLKRSEDCVIPLILSLPKEYFKPINFLLRLRHIGGLHFKYKYCTLNKYLTENMFGDVLTGHKKCWPSRSHVLHGGNHKIQK